MTTFYSTMNPRRITGDIYLNTECHIYCMLDSNYVQLIQIKRLFTVVLESWQRKPTKIEIETSCSGMNICWPSSFHPYSVFFSALRSLALISATTSTESSITSATQ